MAQRPWKGSSHSTEGLKGRTTETHLFNLSSNSYSVPSCSVSSMNLLETLEKEMRGSASKSSGFCGKLDCRGGGGDSAESEMAAMIFE